MFVYVWQVQVREFAALIIMLGGFSVLSNFCRAFSFFFSVMLGAFPFSYRSQCPLLYNNVCSVLN